MKKSNPKYLMMEIFKKSITGIMLASLFLLFSCAPTVTLTGWKNPDEHVSPSKVVVWAMFKRLEYQKPFEEAAADLLNSKGLTGIQALKLVSPTKKYELPELEKILNGAGADALLIFNFKNVNQTKDYVEQTTTFYPSYYSNYYDYYSWGYSGYASVYNASGGVSSTAVTTGGYEVTTTVISLTANLYSVMDKKLLWTGEISITDPKYVDVAAKTVMKKVYADWEAEKIVTAKK
jgi:hypothetical protein